MNLDRAFVLLFATIGTVAGFAPSRPSSVHVVTSSSQRVAFLPKVRVASSLASEVEEGASEVAAADDTPAVEEPAFDTAIYIGNISFGEYMNYSFSCSLYTSWQIVGHL